ncbi:MAG: ABC transporter ATP-binding protein [Eubacteriales bacterium]|nr:ABC transporter ATP-binding protein [Eubacteriales bacterium]
MNTNRQAQWTLVKENRAMYFSAVLATLLTVVLNYLTPLVFSETIDVLLSDGQSNLPLWILSPLKQWGDRTFYRENLWIVAIFVVLLSVLSGLFSYYKERNTAIAGENIAKTLRERLYRRLSYLSFGYHVKAETGDLIQRCTSDVETVRRFLSTQVMEAVRAVLMAVIAFAILFPRSTTLALWSMALLPFMLIYSAIFMKKTTEFFTKSDESEGKMSNVLQENLTGVRVVRAFGMEQREVEKFDEVSSDFREKTGRLLKLLSTYWSSMDGLTMLQIMITLISSVVMVIRGEISMGTLVVFTSYISMLIYPLRQLGRVLSDASKCGVALNRIHAVLKEETEPADGKQRPPLDGDIVFEHVSFRYESDENWVLRDLCMTIPGGMTVAFLGNTGSGKSTIVHLLQRLFEPTEGRITIGGVDLKDIDRWYLRAHVGLMLQEPFLYARNIYDNLSIAAPQARREQVMEMSRTAHADGFIRGFEKGYDTLIGERGVTLSGGQRQRVAIARTLLKENSVLIFDDSLSAVDVQTDRAIRRELMEKRKGVTTIIISHRISTLCEAERIYVLENGKLCDEGTHQELTHRDGLYHEICLIQSELESDLDKSRKAAAKEESECSKK